MLSASENAEDSTGDSIIIMLNITDDSILKQAPAIITAAITQRKIALSGKLVTFLDIIALALLHLA